MNRIEQRKKYKRIIFSVAALVSAAVIYIFISIVLNVTGNKDEENRIASETTQYSDGLMDITIVETSCEQITFAQETESEIITIQESTVQETKENKTKIYIPETETERVTPIKRRGVKPSIEPQTAQEEIIKKPNNTIPAQKERNGVIGTPNMELIRNSVITCINGTGYSKEMEYLAIYMAKNGLANASSAADSLCGYNTLNVTAKTATVSSPSTDPEDILDAAEKAIGKLSGSCEGKYGVGINADFVARQYKIYIVVVIKK